MSLDNKQGQDKLFAFEVNSIIKALRWLAQNIIDLNNRVLHWNYISSESGTDTFSPPSGANIAIIRVSARRGDDEQWTAELIVFRTGKTSASHKWSQLYSSSGNSYIAYSASWSGDTITIGYSSNGTVTSKSATAYYFT